MTSNVPSLAGRIALVTGASRGIGYAASLALAAAGAHVVAVARTVGGLEDLDDRIRKAGGSASLVPLDLTDGEKIDGLGPVIYERWGKLDILVGNAGVLGPLKPGRPYQGHRLAASDRCQSHSKLAFIAHGRSVVAPIRRGAGDFREFGRREELPRLLGPLTPCPRPG